MTGLLIRYGLALLLGEAATLPVLVMGGWSDPGSSILFGVAVALAAFLGGVGPGLLVTLAGAVASLQSWSGAAAAAPASEHFDFRIALWALTAFAVAHLALVWRRRLLEDQRERVAHLETLVRELPVPLATLDADARVVSWNAAAQASFGWKEEEVLDEVLPTVPPSQEARDRFAALFTRVLAGTPIVGEEMTQLRRGGEWAQVRLSMTPLRDGTERVAGAACVLEDISERARGDQRLRERLEGFRTLIRDLDVGVMVLGPDAGVLVCNRAALDLLGLREDEMVGKTAYDAGWSFFREDGTSYPCENYPAVMALTTGRPIGGVVMGVHRPRSGDRVWLLVHAHPELTERGDVERVICTLTDITSLREQLPRVIPSRLSS